MSRPGSDPTRSRHRHPLDEAAYWREREADSARLLAELQARDRIDLLSRLETELELGLLHSYLGEGQAAPGPQQAKEHLTMAMDCGAALALARVCARRGTGFQVEIRRPQPGGGEGFIRLPAQPNGFGWPDWLSAFALALLADDGQNLAVLATADCVDACALSLERVDRFWPLLCAGFAALWQRDGSTRALLDDAAAEMDRSRIMDPARVAALYRPLIALARAIDAGNGAAAARAADAALAAHHDWFAAMPNGSRDPDGLFALPVAALLAEATRRGLGPLLTSDYLLAPLSRPQPAAELILIYPRLSIQSAVEAEWLMQNEGFAHHDRSTVRQSKDGRLVARYRAFDAPGIPVAKLELELLDSERDAVYDGSHAPPALDVGELLYRAEVLASEPRQGAHGEPAYDLSQAVEALDLALAYLDAMPGGFRPDTLHSGVGQRIWEAEPGRFRPERVRIYRNALARQADLPEIGDKEPPRPEGGGAKRVRLEGERPTPAPPPRNAAEAREQVLTLVEELKPLVLPVLQAIALDREGAMMRELAPRDGDYALAFVGEAVAAARQHYQSWWERELAGGAPEPIEPDARIEAHLSPAGMLGSDNLLSRPFPNGFRLIADWLDPHRVWVCWKYLPAGETSGIAMNGLVWLDDHWAWFPKPYRLADVLRRH